MNIMSRSLKHGVTCYKTPDSFTFSYTCPLKRGNFIEIVKKGLFYELLYQLNKDCIQSIAATEAQGRDMIDITLLLNYFDDEAEEDITRVLPLLNTTVITGDKHIEIKGGYNPAKEGINPIKLSMFHLVMELTGSQGLTELKELNFSLFIKLEDRMNILKENALACILQKICGRLKIYIGGETTD